MRFGWAVGVAALSCVASCGGDEFSAEGGGTGGAAQGGSSGSGGSTTGGAAGLGGVGGGIAGAPGGGGTAAIGGSGGGVAGSGSGATGGSGGSGGLPVWVDCGPPPQGQPKLYTTLDDYASIQTPFIGDGTNADANPDNDFHGGKCGSAIQIDGAGEFVLYRIASNIELKKGSLDFWFKPAWDKYDGKVHNLFATSNLASGGIRLFKEDGPGGNVFSVYLFDGQGISHKTAVTPDNYPLVQGQWTRITVFWNFESVGPNAAFWFDKVAVVNYLTTTFGPKSLPATSNPTANLFIGASGTDDGSPAGGLIDDFKIFNFGLNPS